MMAHIPAAWVSQQVVRSLASGAEAWGRCAAHRCMPMSAWSYHAPDGCCSTSPQLPPRLQAQPEAAAPTHVATTAPLPLALLHRLHTRPVHAQACQLPPSVRSFHSSCTSAASSAPGNDKGSPDGTGTASRGSSSGASGAGNVTNGGGAPKPGNGSGGADMGHPGQQPRPSNAPPGSCSRRGESTPNGQPTLASAADRPAPGPHAAPQRPAPPADAATPQQRGTASPSPPPPPPVSPGPPPLPPLAAAHAARVRGAVDAAGSLLLSAAVGLGARLNTLTGYNVIEQLKVKVDEADAGLADAREALRSSKAAFEALVAEHGDVQRQLMALLQRKGSWGRADLDAFTALCARELGLERGVAEAKAAYGAASEGLEGAHAAVLRAIRERYSAETLWSDKIRRASTWWTAGLMGLHLASFLSVYLVMEPIKARRLRSHVEEVLRAEMSGLRGSVAALQTTLDTHVADSPGGAAGGEPDAVAAKVEQPAAAAEPAAAAASDVLPELQRLRRQLAAVERRVAEVGAGQAEQAAAVRALAAAVEPLAAAAAAADDAAAAGAADGAARGVLLQRRGRGQEAAQAAREPGTQGGEAVAAQEEEALHDQEQELEAWMEKGWRGWQARAAVSARRASQRVARWGGWLGGRLREAAEAPEARSAAAAFGGAVLGAGALVLLLERR